MEQKLIIDKLIRVIPFEGISDETLLKVCTDLNLANSFCKFQNGIYSALEHIAEDLNSSMEAELRNSNLEDMKVRERVKLAIQIHLSNYAKLPNYREFLKMFYHSPYHQKIHIFLVNFYTELLVRFGMAFMTNQQILTTIQKEQY